MAGRGYVHRAAIATNIESRASDQLAQLSQREVSAIQHASPVVRLNSLARIRDDLTRGVSLRRARRDDHASASMSGAERSRQLTERLNGPAPERIAGTDMDHDERIGRGNARRCEPRRHQSCPIRI